MTLPNLVVAGAPRCGTTSLFEWLSLHPAVAASSVKETKFFLDEESGARGEVSCVTHDLEAYEAYFAATDPEATVVMEATPHYMHQWAAIEGLRALPGPPRIVFLLRKPSERVYSSYRFGQHVAKAIDPRVEFADAVSQFLTGDETPEALSIRRHVELSRYEVWLERWTSEYPADSIAVRQFEVMRSDPAAFLGDLSRWLRIDPTFWQHASLRPQNASYRVRSHRLDRLAASLKGALPNSASDRIRGAYRRLNSRPAAVRSPDDVAAIDRLDELMEEGTRRAAMKFGLDTSLW